MKKQNNLSFKSLIELYKYQVKKRNIIISSLSDYQFMDVLSSLSFDIRILEKDIMKKINDISFNELLLLIKNDEGLLCELYDQLFLNKIKNLRMYNLSMLSLINEVISKLSFDLMSIMVNECIFNDIKLLFINHYMKIIDNSFIGNSQELLEKESDENEYQRKRKIKCS